MTQIELLLVDQDGRRLGELIVRERPSAAGDGGRGSLADLRGQPLDDGLEPVRLTEGGEYRFEVGAPRGQRIRWEPSELFDLDDETGTSGRLRPRLSTGRVEIVADFSGLRSKPIAIEVQSIKVGYLDDYRHMLHSIARLGSELVLERFAASAQRLQVDAAQNAETLYQRFALLQALLRSESLQAGLRNVLTTPYVSWKEIRHDLSPGSPIRGGAQLARRISGPGARVDWAESPIDGVDSLPRTLAEERTEEVLDNVPNRFVKHALEQWSALVDDMREALVREKRRSARSGDTGPAPIERGLAETDRLSQVLHDFLRHPLFGDVGSMSTFPASNQVLQKRHGYRDVFETYVLYEFGSKLVLRPTDDDQTCAADRGMIYSGA